MNGICILRPRSTNERKAEDLNNWRNPDTKLDTASLPPTPKEILQYNKIMFLTCMLKTAKYADERNQA